MQRLRKRIHVSPATAIATLALVFAMTGGAYAAKHYLITSTKQISPKVLKSLQGKAGKAGANGAQGPAGAAGAAGPQGPAGAAGAKGETGPAGTNGTNGTNGTTGFTKTLPKEQTETGDWSMSQLASSETYVSTGISFVIPLAEAPAPRLVNAKGKELVVEGGSVKEVAPANCTGSPAEPTAPPGSLCVYEHLETGVVAGSGRPKPAICPLGAGTGPFACAEGTALEKWGADRSGFGLVALVEAGLVESEGTWAVTAE
jgi:Collagen triple helix repeat (20 copies)